MKKIGGCDQRSYGRGRRHRAYATALHLLEQAKYTTKMMSSTAARPFEAGFSVERQWGLP